MSPPVLLPNPVHTPGYIPVLFNAKSGFRADDEVSQIPEADAGRGFIGWAFHFGDIGRPLPEGIRES